MSTATKPLDTRPSTDVRSVAFGKKGRPALTAAVAKAAAATATGGYYYYYY